MKWTEHRRVGSTGPCELEQVEGMETEPGSVSWSKLKELRLNWECEPEQVEGTKTEPGSLA